MKAPWIAFLAMLLPLAIAPAARAKDPPDAKRQEKLRRFDLDGDGKLSPEEKAAAKAAAGSKRDRDGQERDGKREKPAKSDRLPELGKLRPEKAQGATLVARFDTDGDGRLSAVETATMQEDFRRRYGAAK